MALVSQLLRPEELLALTDRQREILFTTIASHVVADPAVRKALEPRIAEATKAMLKGKAATAGQRVTAARAARRTKKVVK